MKALIVRGKEKGKEVDVSQWANDWFSLDGYIDPFSPEDIALTKEGMQKVVDDKRKGQLLNWFHIKSYNHDEYIFTFVRSEPFVAYRPKPEAKITFGDGVVRGDFTV